MSVRRLRPSFYSGRLGSRSDGRKEVAGSKDAVPCNKKRRQSIAGVGRLVPSRPSSPYMAGWPSGDSTLMATAQVATFHIIVKGSYLFLQNELSPI